MTIRFVPCVISAINTPVKVLDAVTATGANLIITNGSSTNPIYLGSGAGVTVTNGAVVPPYGVINLRDVSSLSPIYVTAGAIDAGGTHVGVIYGDTQNT